MPSTTVYNVTRMHVHMQACTHCDTRKHTYSHACTHAQHARTHTTCMQSCTCPQVGTETRMHINTHVHMQAGTHGDPQTQLFFGAAAEGGGGSIRVRYCSVWHGFKWHLLIRVQELCESQGGSPGLPVPNSPGFWT